LTVRTQLVYVVFCQL